MYGVTTLFNAGVGEKLIQQRTGHCSTEALRQYECTSQSQLVDVSYVISHGTKVPSNSVLSITDEGTKKSFQCQHHSPVVPAGKNDRLLYYVLWAWCESNATH